MDRPVTIRVRRPADLVGILPYLMGYEPTDSLVIMALKDSRVLVCVRLDLPATSHDHAPFRSACDDVTAMLLRHNGSATILVGYGSADTVTPAVQIADESLTSADVEVVDRLRVHEDRWYSLTCTNPQCCPPQGTPIDHAAASVAAAIYAGMVARPDRDHITAELTPTSGAERDAFAAATRAASTKLLDLLQYSTNPDADLARLVADAWAEAARAYRRGDVLDDTRAAELTVLLDLPPAMVDAVQRTTGEDWQIRMWTDLVRRADHHFAAPVANLLALSALQAGNGVLAAEALACAAEADPADQLTRNIAAIHRLMLSPDHVAGLLRGRTNGPPGPHRVVGPS